MQAEIAAPPPSLAARVSDRLGRLLPKLAMGASRGIGVGLQFVVQIVVGSLAGPAGLGVLQLFMSWSCILGEVFALGLPARSMRITAVTWAQRDLAGTRAALGRAAFMSLRFAVCFVSLFSVILWLLATTDNKWAQSESALIFMAALLAAPLFALARIGAEALKAVEAPISAISFENMIVPCIVLLMTTLCWRLGLPLTSTVLLLAGITGLAFTALALWRSVLRRLPGDKTTPGRTEKLPGDGRDLRALWGSSVLGIGFLHLPFLILPWYAGTAEVGIYAVAHKLVNIVTTLLILLSAVFGPAFARAAAESDRAGLKALLWRTQGISLAIYLPLVLALLMATQPLAELFHVPQADLRAFLFALAAGQLVNAATGLPGVLLNMSGAADREMRTLVVALSLALLCAPLIGAAYGATGLAWLFSAMLAAKNLASYWLANKHLKRIGNSL